MKRLIRNPDVRRVAVGVGIDGDRADSKALAGARDAHGDFAAIGDQKGTDQSGYIR